MPKRKAGPVGAIDYTALTRPAAARSHDWYEMERTEDGGEPLRVRIRRLTLSELEAIPGGEAKLVDVIAACRDYVVAWNLTGTTDAGEEMAVPPPAEVAPASVPGLLEGLLTIEELQFIYQRLRFGHLFKVEAAKKASGSCGDTPGSSSAAG